MDQQPSADAADPMLRVPCPREQDIKHRLGSMKGAAGGVLIGVDPTNRFMRDADKQSPHGCTAPLSPPAARGQA
jgi:hypothetical protein